MYRFEYCRTALECPFNIPELPNINRSALPSDSTVRITVGEREVPHLADWTHQWMTGSHPTLSVGRAGGIYVVQVGTDSSYLYEPRSRTIELTTGPSPRHHSDLLNQVLPRVLDHDGRFLMHGSAVQSSSGVISFVGTSGWGKSTLVSALQTDGASPLSDDCMEFLIERNTAICRATYPSLRLWQDSADAVPPGDSYRQIPVSGEKQRFHSRQETTVEDLPLTVIYLLTDPDQPVDEVSFKPLAPARAVSELLKHCFRLDPSDEGRARSAFDTAVDVVQRVPTFVLTYPRDYGRLSEVAAAVVEHAALSAPVRSE